jgi:hypothetical protein
MTQTNKNNFKRTIRICYPAGTRMLVIRTDLDWGRDTNPVAVSSDGNTATFEIEAQQRFVHFKPCLVKNASLHWAVGPDNLLIMAGQDARTVYPYFFSDSRRSLKLNQRYLEDTIGCEFTCRPATTRTRRHVTPRLHAGRTEPLLSPGSISARALGNRRNQSGSAGYAGNRRPGHCRRLFEWATRGGVYQAGLWSLRSLDCGRARASWTTVSADDERSGGSLNVGFLVRRRRFLLLCVGISRVFGGAVCMSSTFSYQDDLIEPCWANRARRKILSRQRMA